MASTSYVYLISPTFQFMNVSGKPLVDGYINLYISGTRSKYYAFSDFEGTLHPFNIPLNALGSAVILVSPAHSYDIYVYNSVGTLQMSRYNITPATGEGTVITDVTTLNSNDNTVDITSNSSTEYNLSIATKINELKKYTDQAKNDAIESANTSIAVLNDKKKDKQNELNFNGSATKTVKKITQNANGELNVEFTNIAGGGGGGTTYTAGDAIDITDNAISVKYSKGLELNIDNQLEVKSGKGLTFDNNNNLKVSVGEGIYFDSNGKLTTELPDDWIDITNEWVFINNFRLQYNGEFPGFGNEMTVWYSKIRKLVKFTGSMRVNTTSSFSDSEWHVFMQYRGNRFYDSYNAPNVSLAPKIYPTQIGGITSVPATGSSGRTLNALMKLSYIGAPTTTPEFCGLGMQLFIPSNMTVNGAIMEGIQLSVTPIE